MIHTTPSSGTSEASHYLLPNHLSNNNRTFSSLSVPSPLGYSPSSLDGQASPHFYQSPPTSPQSMNLIESSEDYHHEDLKFMESGQDDKSENQHRTENISNGHEGNQTHEHEEEFRVDTSIGSVLRRFSRFTLGFSYGDVKPTPTLKNRHSINISTSISTPITESRKFSMGQTLSQHPNTLFIFKSPQSPITPSPTTSSSSLAIDLDHQIDSHPRMVDQTISRSSEGSTIEENYSPSFTRVVSLVFNNATNGSVAVGSERKRRDSIASNKKGTDRVVNRNPSNITSLINNTSFHSTKKQLEKEKKRRGESCSKFCHSCFTTSNILLTVFILQAIVCLTFGVSIMGAGGQRLILKIREYQLLQIRAFVEERISTFTSKYTTMANHMMESLKRIAINDNVALLRFFDFAAKTFGTGMSLRRIEFYRTDDSFSMLRDFNLTDGQSVISINSKSQPFFFSTYRYPRALVFVDNPDGYYASSTDVSYSIYKSYFNGPLLELDELIRNKSVVDSFILDNQKLFCKPLMYNITTNYNNFKWMPSKSIDNSSIFLHFPVYISNDYNHTIFSPNLKKMYIVNSAQNLNNTYLFGVISLHFSIESISKLLEVQNERFYLESEYSLNTSFIMNTRGEILAVREDRNKNVDYVSILHKAIMKHSFKKHCEVESETLNVPHTKFSARLSYTCDGRGLNLILVVGMDYSDSFVPLLLANNNSILSFMGAFGLIIVSIIVMIAIMRTLNTSIERIGKNLHRITKLKQMNRYGQSEGMKSFNQTISDIFPNTSTLSKSIFFEIREIENLVNLLGKGMDALKKFLPEPFVKEIMLSKPLPFNVAIKQNLTIMLCGLTDCDMMADSIGTALFLEMITEYSSIICKTIQDHNGMIDRFDGGTALCLFSFQDYSLIPAEKNKEVNACHAAMDIIYMMDEFKSKWKKITGHAIHIQIGINSGDIYYGNLDCTDLRSSYSVMGSNMDITFALQRLNSAYSTQVLIGEETYLRVKDIFVCYFVDLIRFSGHNKRTGMDIYSLESPLRESTDLERKVAMDLEQVQQQIMENNYASALSLCEKVMLLNDTPQIYYLYNRLRQLKESSSLVSNENDLFSATTTFGIDPEQVSQFF